MSLIIGYSRKFAVGGGGFTIEAATSSDSASPTASTSLAPSMPSHTTDDLIIAAIAWTGTATFSSVTGGWTDHTSGGTETVGSGSTQRNMKVFSKVATSGAEAVTCTVSGSSDWGYVVVVVRGGATVNQWLTPTAYGNASTAIAAPTGTVQADDMVYAFAMGSGNNTLTAESPARTNYTSGSATEGDIQVNPADKSGALNIWSCFWIEADTTQDTQEWTRSFSSAKTFGMILR